MDRLRIGDVEIVALHDGETSLPLAEHFPETASASWARYREDYPRAFDGEAWRVALRFYLVRTPRRAVLVDTGFNAELRAGWNIRGRAESLGDVGLTPDDIDTVVLTHIHGDHVGGTIDEERRPRFRRYVLHRDDLALAREKASTAKIFERTILAIERAGRLETVSGGEAIDDHVTLLHTPGHTPGSLSALIASGGEKALLVGDAIHHPALIAQPEWRDKSDSDHAEAVRTRHALVERVAAEGLVLAPSHFPEPFGKVVRVEGRAVWRAL